MDIIINKPTPAIVKEAVLENLPDFIVITGENGTGKTQFLSYLYTKHPSKIVDEDPMMIDDPIFMEETGVHIQNENGDHQFIPNIKITYRDKELKNIVYRNIQTPYVDIGYSLNVADLISRGRKFVHKYIFYEMYKKSLKESDYHLISNADNLNKLYIKEREFQQYNAHGNINEEPKVFSTEDKNLIERIMANHEKIDYSLIQYYYIAYLPTPNSSIFSTNLGFLFIQYWARIKAGLVYKESPLVIFNEVAKEAGFRYILQEPIISENETNVTIKLYDNETNNLVDINRLSSGEKVILSLVLAIYTSNTDAQFPELILFDEPDAYLHPSMSRFMLNVLQNVFVKEKGIKVIMSTHSPTTVALAPEYSLYKMDRNLGRIVKTDQKEAIGLLSEGIFTFEEGIQSFNIIRNSSKNTILCVEGKTDVLHITSAMQKLKRNLDIEIIDLHDAGTLADFIKSIPASILGGKKIIGLFDNDGEGRKNYKKISGVETNGYKRLTSEQSCGYAYVCYLPASIDLLDENCPIEFLYPKKILEANNILEKRNFGEFKNSFKNQASTPNDDKLLIDEYENGSTLRVFKVRDSYKNRFAENLNILSNNDFIGFNPLFDLLEKIIINNNHYLNTLS
ncbi:AAA family ATPase [Dysgonomonas mossii]|uniref:AAA family ATPase n=1 Tax=Dysgonomonas mossii TaxID=163665 RepID=UPI0039951CC1